MCAGFINLPRTFKALELLRLVQRLLFLNCKNFCNEKFYTEFLLKLAKKEKRSF